LGTAGHLQRIGTDNNYHKTHTEIYLVLEGTGHLELDGELVPVRPFSTVLIQPLCRHRAVGWLRIVNICIPPFDPADEWFD
jgi:mannose-6-phosphate isomerase-like protein (cupin superfamily)